MSNHPRNLILTVVILLLGTANLSAQQESKTIVLKDGTVIVGTIVRQTDDSLEVRSDSTTVVIAASMVRRIQNRIARSPGQDSTTTQTAATQKASPAANVEDAFHVWEIFAGVALPTGAFAATDLSRIGFASTGFSLGGLYRIDLEKGFEVGFTGMFDYYPFDKDAFANRLVPGTRIDVGSWYLVWTFGSIGMHLDAGPERRLHVAGLVGYMYGISPKVNATNGTASYSQSSAGSEAFSYGGEVGYYIKGVDITVKYVAADIEYKFSTGSGTIGIKQPTGAIQIVVGVKVN